MKREHLAESDWRMWGDCLVWVSSFDTETDGDGEAVVYTAESLGVVRYWVDPEELEPVPGMVYRCSETPVEGCWPDPE